MKFALRVFEQDSASELVHQFLYIQGFKDRGVIARRLGIHPSALDRLLAGRVDPNLERMFQMFDLCPTFLDQFLARLQEAEPGFQNAEDPEGLEQMQMKYVTQFPWALSVIGALETVHFQNFSYTRLGELANFLSLDIKVLTQTLEDFCRLKILTKKAAHYELTKVYFDTGSLPMKEVLKPIQYWTEKVARRLFTRISLLENGQFELSELPGLIYFSDYRVLSLSASARDEVNRAIASFVGQIKTIAQNQTDPKENVSCILLHHFQPGILPPELDFDESWLRSRPESFYWSKKFREE
ncbi:MAG: hypothetical protein IPK04_04375 [Bdellovibrionales bacterium]|nr:hypothetical protein [Bdellovibrionales bacterium]